MVPAQQMAEKLYKDAYMRWCYELSEEKNQATAKNAAEYVCNQIIEALKDAVDENLLIPHIMYWNRVKEHIQQL